MCGRFTLTQTAEQITNAFQLPTAPHVVPRYNIAPTQPVPAVVMAIETGDREFRLFYWGLIPSWAKDIKMGARLINARAETVAEKPSFRTAFKRRRCLIVADGFYEWKRSEKGKQPYYFYLGSAEAPEERSPFGFAGLWEHWESSEGDTIESCTILTTAANDLLSPIHDRMPVILHPQDYEVWLDPTLQKPEALQPLLRPFPTEEMGSHAVSSRMNNARTDDPDCIQPIRA